MLIYPYDEVIMSGTKAFWGRSSVWLERQIVDLKVAGSTPVVPANWDKERLIVNVGRYLPTKNLSGALLK